MRQAARRLVPVRVRTGERALTGWAENRSLPAHRSTMRSPWPELSRGRRPARGDARRRGRTSDSSSPDGPGAVGRLPRRRDASDRRRGRARARPPGRGRRCRAARLRQRRPSRPRARSWHSRCPRRPPRRGGSGPPGVCGGRDRPASGGAAGYRSFFVRRPVSNLLEGLSQSTTRVTSLTMGDVTLLGVPGEVTEEAAERIVAGLPRPRPSASGFAWSHWRRATWATSTRPKGCARAGAGVRPGRRRRAATAPRGELHRRSVRIGDAGRRGRRQAWRDATSVSAALRAGASVRERWRRRLDPTPLRR